MSIRLLNAIDEREPTIHTALDDLESFLWVFIWAIVHALKDIPGARDNIKGINLMLKAWQGEKRLKRLAIVGWKDVVFRGLIEEWLGIFERAEIEAERVMDRLPSIPLDNRQGSRWNNACDRLTSYCTNVYEEILKSGFRTLESIQNYPDWEAVVAANMQAQAQAEEEDF